jgi:hypothetical protein
MRANAQDLVDELTEPSGARFQHFVHALVVSEARSCRIPLYNIHYDNRVNVPDGGRDIIVNAQNSRRTRFIPRPPSIWSVKSGAEGADPSALRREINDPRHAELQEHLRRGHKYVWCALRHLSQGQRDAMVDAARKIESDLGLQPNQIEFRWNEALAALACEHPNLLAVHLPGLSARLHGVHTLLEWQRSAGPGFGVGWVDFDGRSTVCQRITQHLLAREGPNVLHIAGFSGIGKTRTVFEACRSITFTDPRGREIRELEGVFYLARHTGLSPELYRYLEEEGRHAQLVIDEVPLSELDTIAGRVSHLSERVRVVTIGPALRLDAGRRAADPNVLLLAGPTTEGGVLAVARSAGAGVPDEVLRSIAEASAHDLRLALLLVDAAVRLTEFRAQPVVDVDGIWARLMALFGSFIGDTARFRDCYEVLTASIDVGRAGRYADELRFLADHFHTPLPELERTISRAAQCGLAVATDSFFEAVPRALAVRLFQDRVWDSIRPRLSEFQAGMPERLLRRFVERCQECGGDVREEVQAALADLFLAQLRPADITQLIERGPSRLFQAWAEFDPDRGLAWLRGAVLQASPEQLLALRGGADGSGGWRGRRQVVWMCQNLASFAEHFEPCEDVLFRLAQFETEPGIGNNGTIVWQSLYWPAPGYTAAPFSARLPRLIHRLRTATAESLPLALSGALGSIAASPGTIPLPPRVVGGRVVPEPWQPKTYGELHRWQAEAGREIIDALRGLPEPLRQVGAETVARHLHDFIRLGLLPALRDHLFRGDLSARLRRSLVDALEERVAYFKKMVERGEERARPGFEELSRWLESLAPSDLATRVVGLTSREYWSVHDATGSALPYDELARAVVDAPSALPDLADWLDSPEARSAGALGLTLGRHDINNRLAPTITGWLHSGRCGAVAVNYLVGASSRTNGLSPEWVAELDRCAAAQPALAARVTLAADPTARGFRRLVGLLDRLPAPRSAFLHHLGYPQWVRILSADDRAQVLTALLEPGQSDDRFANEVALDLVANWSEHGKEPLQPGLVMPLLTVVQRVLTHPDRVQEYCWQLAMRLLAPHQPEPVIAALADTLASTRPGPPGRTDTTLELLIELAGAHPQAVMHEVGRAILDPQRRPIFGALIFRGLFEAIGLPVVQGWVELHGNEQVRWIARHIASPYLDDVARPIVPPLTAWVLESFEADERVFRDFCMGRHGFEFRSGPVESREELERRLRPFRDHPLRCVREWVDYELVHRDWEARVDAQMDDEHERT